MMRRILYTLLFLGHSFNPFCQDFHQDIAAVVANLENSSYCHIVSTVTIYESKKTKQKVASFGAELKRSDLDYRSKMDAVELISNGDFLIMVDYEDKFVQIEKSEKTNKAELNYLKEFYAIDSVGKVMDTVVCTSSQEGINSYQLTLKKGMIQNLLVVIDTKKNALLRLEYEYNKTYFPSNNYIVIEYSSFSLNPQFDKSLFQGTDVVTKRGNEFVLKEKYKNFELINLYNEVR